MIYVLCFVILFVLELCYFRIATHFNILDQPNIRSSHSAITLRGAGIIFFFSVLLYYIFFGFSFPLFAIGLLLLTAVSLADDISHQSKRLRSFIQFIAVGLMLYDAGLHANYLVSIPAIIAIVALLNAYNFMDGINGMTAAYSFSVLAALYFANAKAEVFDQKLLIIVAIGNLVFSFFNFRKNAKCFAGDVGSITMAYILMLLTCLLIIATGKFIILLFYAVYVADVSLTIGYRLIKKENIFLAHRRHLFQFLANEKQMPHLTVSVIYAIIQALISAGVLLIWNKPATYQLLYAMVVVMALCMMYIAIKRKNFRLPEVAKNWLLLLSLSICFL